MTYVLVGRSPIEGGNERNFKGKCNFANVKSDKACTK